MGDRKSFFSGKFLKEIKRRPGRNPKLYSQIYEEWKKGLFFGVFISAIWVLFTKADSTADAIAIALFYGPGEKCLGTPLRWLHGKLVKLKVIPPSRFFLRKQPYRVYNKKEDNSDGCESCNHGCTFTRTKVIEPDWGACAYAMVAPLEKESPKWLKYHPGHYWDVEIINRLPSHRVLQDLLEKNLPKELSALVLTYLETKLPYYYLMADELCKIGKLRKGSIEIIEEVHLKKEDLIYIIKFFLPEKSFNTLMRYQNNGRKEIRQY